jgi:hypothetical protein
MFATGSTLQVSAISKEEIVVQWLAPVQMPAIGCPAAPALLAVSKVDYQNIVSWVQTPDRRRLYK